MKKFVSVLIALISVICIVFTFGGCGKNEEKSFYTLTEAYEKGYLTREQVMSIAYYHNGGTKWNEEIMGEDYSPLPIIPEELSAETENALKQDYLDYYWQDKKDTTSSEARIKRYYGTYNDCVAVMMTVDFGGTFDMIWTEIIEDISIYYRDGNNIVIWKNA